MLRADYPPARSHRYPPDMRLGGTPSGGEKKNTCPCREFNLGHPIHSQSLQRRCNINIPHQQVGEQTHLFSQTRFPFPLYGIQRTNIWGGSDTRAKVLDFWEMNLRKHVVYWNMFVQNVKYKRETSESSTASSSVREQQLKHNRHTYIYNETALR
jgi:hypothetical protein